MAESAIKNLLQMWQSVLCRDCSRETGFHRNKGHSCQHCVSHTVDRARVGTRPPFAMQCSSLSALPRAP